MIFFLTLLPHSQSLSTILSIYFFFCITITILTIHQKHKPPRHSFADYVSGSPSSTTGVLPEVLALSSPIWTSWDLQRACSQLAWLGRCWCQWSQPLASSAYLQLVRGPGEKVLEIGGTDAFPGVGLGCDCKSVKATFWSAYLLCLSFMKLKIERENRNDFIFHIHLRKFQWSVFKGLWYLLDSCYCNSFQ